jgi:hypothetical protein
VPACSRGSSGRGWGCRSSPGSWRGRGGRRCRRRAGPCCRAAAAASPRCRSSAARRCAGSSRRRSRSRSSCPARSSPAASPPPAHPVGRAAGDLLDHLRGVPLEVLLDELEDGVRVLQRRVGLGGRLEEAADQFVVGRTAGRRRLGGLTLLAGLDALLAGLGGGGGAALVGDLGALVLPVLLSYCRRGRSAPRRLPCRGRGRRRPRRAPRCPGTPG